MAKLFLVIALLCASIGCSSVEYDHVAVAMVESDQSWHAVPLNESIELELVGDFIAQQRDAKNFAHALSGALEESYGITFEGTPLSRIQFKGTSLSRSQFESLKSTLDDLPNVSVKDWETVEFEALEWGDNLWIATQVGDVFELQRVSRCREGYVVVQRTKSLLVTQNSGDGAEPAWQVTHAHSSNVREISHYDDRVGDLRELLREVTGEE